MTAKFTIARVGHVGIYVSDLEAAVAWYTGVLGLTLTGRWPTPGGGEIVFLRFQENHHDIVLMPKPEVVAGNPVVNRLQHIAMEMENRDEWLKALAALWAAGVKITAGSLVHGFEGGTGPGTLPGGSGSRSFYFEDPDGNSLELYADMMRVPAGQPSRHPTMPTWSTTSVPTAPVPRKTGRARQCRRDSRNQRLHPRHSAKPKRGQDLNIEFKIQVLTPKTPSWVIGRRAPCAVILAAIRGHF